MGTTPWAEPARARPKTTAGLRPRAAVWLVAILLAIVGALYFAARETSVFAIHAIEVTGSQPEVVEAARTALASLAGKSLVAIDIDEVERRLRELPSVRTATVDRDFPRTLDVHVRPEQAVAVARHGESAWLVAATGRIIRRIGPGASPDLPRIWLSPEIAEPAPGTALVADEGGAPVAALAALPRDFPVTVRAARGTPDDLTLRIGSGLELRLGSAHDLRLKLRVAATVLDSLSRSEREALAYLDVSLPARPVGGPGSQVEAEA